MSRRIKILIIVGIVLGAAILIPVIRHYQLRFAVESYVAELKAKGVPMDLAQVIPPSLPLSENGADFFRKANEAFDGSFQSKKSFLQTNYVYGMSMVAPAKAMVQWQQPDVRNFYGTNSWKDVDDALAQNAEAFTLLQQMIEKPAFDFQLKYESGVADLNFTNFYLAESKRAAQHLETAVLSDLHDNDTASAMKNMRAMLALVKAMSDERLIISELVRIAIAQMAVTANWEILQLPNLTDKQLAELQRDWEDLDFIRSEVNALAMESMTGRITAAKWRKSGSSLEDSLNNWDALSDQHKTDWDELKIKAKMILWRFWWSYPDEIRALESYEVFLGTAHFAETNYSFQTAIARQNNKLAALHLIKTNEPDFFANPAEADFHSLLSQDVASMSAVFNKVMRVETAKQVMITAIALKRYQLKHGNYPADLNALVPEFVSVVPRDPVDGQPLRYRRNADGTFLLYSIGENGKDDGGNPALEPGTQTASFQWQNSHALDWVWPQPATSAEIQKYYEEQAKKPN